MLEDRVREVAADEGVSMAQVAVTRLLRQEPAVAPVVGVAEREHVDEAVEAVDRSLSASDVAYIEEPYEPTLDIGHECRGGRPRSTAGRDCCGLGRAS